MNDYIVNFTPIQTLKVIQFLSYQIYYKININQPLSIYPDMQNPSYQPLKLEQFIEKTKRNGFFTQLKQLGSQPYDISLPNKFETMHRQNVTSMYSKNTKKPFRLVDQPQYQNQLQFNHNFGEYMETLDQFHTLKNQKPLKVQKLEHKIEREAYENSLLYNPEQHSLISPSNINKRKKKYRAINNLSYQQFHSPNVFSKTKLQQAIQIENNNQFSFATSPTSNFSPKRRTKNLTAQRKFKLQSHRTYGTLSNVGTSGIQTDRSNKINESLTLLTLNKIQDTDLKRKNFRMQKLKFHQLLQKRYGHDIIPNFFGLQVSEDFNGMLTLLKQIIRSTDKLAQMLTFLTLDYDQDGLISQYDLSHLNNIISNDNIIANDIHLISAYVKKNKHLNCESDLPRTFLVNPTIKQYLKMNNQHKSIQIDKNKGVFRLFTLKGDQQSEDDEHYINPSKKSSKKNSTEFPKKKFFKINFEHFQKIFEDKKRPEFINDLLEYLMGKKEQPLLRQNTKDSIPYSINSPTSSKRRSNKRLLNNFKITQMKSKTLNIHNNPRDFSKMQEILQKIQQEKKALVTIKYY